MNPAALDKAHSLARIAKEQGAPLSEFVLTLTTPEAYELLDYIAAGGLGVFQEQEQLKADVAKARKQGDPFPLLAWFHVEGFQIMSVESLH